MIIPALEVKPLSQKFISRLDSIVILEWHHQVIDVENIFVAVRRSIVAFSSSLKSRINEMLGLFSCRVV